MEKEGEGSSVWRYKLQKSSLFDDFVSSSYLICEIYLLLILLVAMDSE